MRPTIVISLTLLACSSSTPAPTPTCTPDTCQRALSFVAGPDLPAALDHHATVIATTAQGSFLYVLGGNDYRRQFRNVWMAPLAEDGTVGAWSETTMMPEQRAGSGVALVRDRIVIVSGQARGFLSTVISAKVSPDGTLGAWEAEPDLPAARFHSYAVASGDWLYATGGVDDQFNATTTNYRAPLDADGRLGAFSEVTSFPVPRSHHVALIHDGYLLVAGGLTGNPAADSHDLAEVLSAPIENDGTLGAFATVATLVDPPATLAGFELDGSWYLVGGLDDHSHYLADVLRLPFGAGGTLGEGELMMPGLPIGRSHVHQTPIHGNHIYSIGGSVGYQTLTSAVQVGTFSWEPKTLALRKHRQAFAVGPRKPHCPMGKRTIN